MNKSKSSYLSHSSLTQFAEDDNAGNNYVQGIKQITEVSLKAMSPGINDPATAITTIDQLTELLSLRMHITDHQVYADDRGFYKVILTGVSFDTPSVSSDGGLSPVLQARCLADAEIDRYAAIS